MEVFALVKLFELQVHSFCFGYVGPDWQVHFVPFSDVVLEFLLYFYLGQSLFQTIGFYFNELW